MKSSLKNESNPVLSFKDDIVKYFKLLKERKLSDAEKILEYLKQNLKNSEWGKGYLKGLEGLYLTSKSNNDEYLFFSRITLTKNITSQLLKEFKTHINSSLHADYDRGYFQALYDYVKELKESLKPES
jgi:fatty acid/phospholipid biosynthesis enzyme